MLESEPDLTVVDVGIKHALWATTLLLPHARVNEASERIKFER